MKQLLLQNGEAPVLPANINQTDASKLDEMVFDIAVSVDGSWKNRGFKSHHGVVTVVSADSGEILDTEYLCNYCV